MQLVINDMSRTRIWSKEGLCTPFVRYHFALFFLLQNVTFRCCCFSHIHEKQKHDRSRDNKNSRFRIPNLLASRQAVKRITLMHLETEVER